MTAGGEMQDRFLGLEIDSSLRRKIVAKSSFVSARKTLALAKARSSKWKTTENSWWKSLSEESSVAIKV